MRSLTLAVAAVVALAGSAFGQYEVNKAGASLNVDGLTTDGTFAASAPYFIGSGATLNFSTSSVGLTFDIAYNNAALVAPGTPLAGQSVNLDIAQGFTFLSGGPGFTAFGGGLGANGFAVSLAITAPAAPTDLSLQAYAIDPTAPGGLALSQGSHMSVTNSIVATPSLSDDSFSQQTLGQPFTYYGVTYNDVFIGSNGFLTFGAGSTDFSESVAEFLSMQPRIAGLWDDLNPSLGGTVTYVSDAGTGATTVTFTGISEFGTTNSNDFVMAFDAGQVVLTHGLVASLDSIVGLSPGGGLALGQPFDISANIGVGFAVTPGEAPYEQFTAFDLVGTTHTYLLDAAGNPILAL